MLSLRLLRKALERKHFVSSEKGSSCQTSLNHNAEFWRILILKVLTEKERFQKWERSLDFKATDRECSWALKKARQLDLARLTKWPSTVLES